MEKETDELVNIAMFCDTVLVRFGKVVDMCNAIYISEDDAIEFRIRYKEGEAKRTYQYHIQNFNFIITDSEVLVNRGVIGTLNEEITKRVCTYV